MNFYLRLKQILLQYAPSSEMGRQLSWQSSRLLIYWSRVRVADDPPFPSIPQDGSLAQLVEQQTFNLLVPRSSRGRPTIFLKCQFQITILCIPPKGRQLSWQSSRLLIYWSRVRVADDPPFFLRASFFRQLKKKKPAGSDQDKPSPLLVLIRHSRNFAIAMLRSIILVLLDEVFDLKNFR